MPQEFIAAVNVEKFSANFNLRNVNQIATDKSVHFLKRVVRINEPNVRNNCFFRRFPRQLCSESVDVQLNFFDLLSLHLNVQSKCNTRKNS